MLRNRAVALILCWLASPFVWGLGLGPLQANSGLNEAFEGRIEILGSTAEDFDALTVGLAGVDHFARAGIDRGPVLFQLRFTIDDSAEDKNYITVSSQDPIREPFLNFLLEVNWSNGRLLREYTVLLDPPIYDPNRGRIAAEPSPAVEVPLDMSEPAPVAAPETPVESFDTSSDMAAPRIVAPSGDYVTGAEVGPMIATDTLWSISSARRPNESVTVQQMMLALLRENPDAFSDGNINMLRRGAILRLPDQATIGSVTMGEAFAEVKRQNQVWEEYRQQLGLAPTAQPMGAPATEPPPDMTYDAQADAEVDSRLELLAPGADESGGAPGSVGAGADLLREELDAQSQLNADLDDKLTEAEEIIDLLQRQVNIKDEELAALQARLAELGIEHGDIGATEAPIEEPPPVEPDAVVDEDPEVAPAGEPDVAIEEDVEVDVAPDIAIEEDIEVDVAPDIAIEEDLEVDVAPDVAEDEIPVDEPELVDSEPEDIIEMDTGPPAEAGFPANLIPESIASMVPGGALTILGIVAVGILGLFVGVVQFLLKSRAGSSAAPVATVVAPPVAEEEPEPDDVTEEPDITSVMPPGTVETVTAVADDDASEDETEEFDPDVTKDEFDPDATLEADAESEAEPQEDLEATVAYAGAAAQAAAAPADEEDPLEEVNVYLAYERFDQAEELVKRVVGEYPDRHEYKLRLLEVYYSSNDKGAYEASAKELNDAVGESDPLWESAVAMWSEMSPERALFEEGAEVAEAAPDQDAAKTFVDITGDSEETEAGANTMVMAPGSDADEGLDFDLAAADDTAADDEGILDLTAATGDDDGGMLDLTAADGSADAADGVLDITDGGDDGILDITESGGDAGDDLLDLTGGDTEGIMDITAMDDGGVDASDLLDVTKTGDMTGVEDDDLLNVTSPGLSDDEELDVVSDSGQDEGLEITESGADRTDDEALDFDISDTVAPAFDLDADAEAERVLDITETSAVDDAGAGDDNALEFDIGGLDAGGGDALGDMEPDESPTVDLDSALEEAQKEASTETGTELDFDITMGASDLEEALDVSETDIVDEGSEITMSSDQAPPSEPDLELQVEDDGDEISIDDAADLNVEEDDFGFSLENTAEMDGIAADDTLDMAQSDTGGPGTLDIGDDASLDDLTMELDAAMDDVSADGADDGGLELEIEGVAEGGDDGHLDTVKLDDDGPEIIDDHAEKTVVMPRAADVETQSDVDEADTKLNLAKAYIELGDTEGARSILDEVANDGNDAQKAEAKSLLDQLSS